MVSKDMLHYGTVRSCIRELFEYGKQRAAVVGEENVYDFSLGNPSVPAPEEVNQVIRTLVNEMPAQAIHSYTSGPGSQETRKAIADNLNKRFGTDYRFSDLYMTTGAAAALTSVFRALTLDDKTEFIAFAPFFTEYSVFATTAGGKLTVIPADIPAFQIDFEKLEASINANTQAVIVNSPNNPSGVIYTEATIRKLAELLKKKSAEIGHPIYIISDEPYRELVYEGTVPFVPQYYPNTIVCYSYSKSLSLPGERIGYVLVPGSVEDHDMVYNAIAGAGRILGYVCAPSLMQHVLVRCADVKPDLRPYRENRDLIYNALTEMGYNCAKPSGAFYLFVEAPNGDARAFSDMAKQHDLLIVPGNDFGCPTYIRISYCVDHEMIKRSLPVFKKLIDQIKG